MSARGRANFVFANNEDRGGISRSSLPLSVCCDGAATGTAAAADGVTFGRRRTPFARIWGEQVAVGELAVFFIN